jgi:hypothetical protein
LSPLQNISYPNQKNQSLNSKFSLYELFNNSNYTRVTPNYSK